MIKHLNSNKPMTFSDQACWSIAEENGVKTISNCIKAFQDSVEIIYFGCLALSSIPRKGIFFTDMNILFSGDMIIIVILKESKQTKKKPEY